MKRAEAKVIASGSLLLLALVGFGLAKLLERRTRTWPKTWATVHSTEMQLKELDDKTDIILPCFTFSYVVNEKNFSGRFSLFTDGEEEGELVAKRMIGHKFKVQYHPKRPSSWYIPDKRMKGYEVEQKGSPHLFKKLAPTD
jgi:hypothetical protein